MYKNIDVFTMPRAKRDNAYHTLGPSMVEAYSQEITSHAVPYNNLLLVLLRRPWSSPRRVLCIHWSTILYGSKYTLKSLALLCMNTVGIFLLKYAFNFKIVWVMHNNFAHDYPHPWIDSMGRRLLFRTTDALVAQQNVTQAETAELYPEKKVVYIPHCNYVGAWGELVRDRADVRTRFGFAPEDIVLVSFGTVKPYKKIECFIDALQKLGSSLSPRVKLWVVGKSEPEYLQFLKDRAQGSPNMRIEGNSVAGEETPVYAACADWGVFYFDESELTTASVLSLLSYGCPVISRSIAGTEMVIEGKSGFVFENDEQLLDVLRKISHLTPPAQDRVVASVEGMDWASVERRYLELYRSLTEVPPVL